MLVSNAHIVSIAPLSSVTQFGDAPWAAAALSGDPRGLQPRAVDRVS